MTTTRSATPPEKINIPDFKAWLTTSQSPLKKGERTRLDIIIATQMFLKSRPLDALTIAKICDLAGVAHGTFYIYFRDRGAIIETVLGLFVDYLQLGMRHAARNDTDPIRATTAAYFHLFQHNAHLMKCLIISGDQSGAAQDAFHRLNKDWANIVVRAAQRQNTQLPPDELMRRAYALGAMVDQYLTALFVTQDPGITALSQDYDATINTLTTLWKKGMMP